jgi:ABC-2 type transport system permease protein
MMYNSARELNNIWTIARKEFMDNVVSKRFLIIGIVYFAMALLLAGLVIYLYTSYAGVLNDANISDWTRMQAQSVVDSFKPDMVLSYMNTLNIVLALLAVFVSADTLSAEKKDRTILQLMSKPVDRSSIIMGKFLGCLGVVTSLFMGSALVAYILVAIVTGKFPAIGDIPMVLAAIVSMVLMLAVYVAIGVLISTVTKNPFISIIGSLLVWIGLWFCGTIGDFIGQISQASSTLIVGDPFNSYPIVAKVMVWVNPLSHSVMPQLLDPTSAQVAAGMPTWANVVFVLAYTGILLAIAILLFERENVSG